MQQDNNLKKVYILGSSLVLGLMAIIYLFGHSILIVNLPENSQGVLLSSQKIGSDTKPEALRPGINILEKGQYIISASKNQTGSKRPVDIKPFRITTADMSLVSQKVTKKIARGTSECIFGSEKQLNIGTVGSYDCIEPNMFFINNFSQYSRKSILAETGIVFDPLPYKGGIVGLQVDEEGQHSLTFIDTNGETIKKLDAGSGYSDSAEYKLAVDNNKIKLLDIKNKLLYSQEGVNERPSKTTLQIDQDMQKSFTHFVSGSEKNYIFIGNPGNENADSISSGEILVFNDGSSNYETRFDITDSAEEFLSFQIGDGGSIITSPLNGNVNIYKPEVDNLNLFDSLQNFSSPIIRKGDIYLISDGNIYMYDQKTRSQGLVFTSSKISVSKLHSINGLLLFSGFSNTESDPVSQLYIVEGQNLDDNERVEDKLPYGDIDYDIAWMDYLDKKIFVALSLDSLQSDLGSIGYEYEQQEYLQKSTEIKKQLAKDGFSSNEYSISVSPY